MLPENFTEFFDDLVSQVKSQIIPMSRIDDAVERILRVKFVMGLFEDPIADLSLANKLGSQVIYFRTYFFLLLSRSLSIVSTKPHLFLQEHRDLAREAVRKSLVLLKNGKIPKQPLLPLPKKAPKILVAGTHADNLGYQCGGWTIEWQGVKNNDFVVGMLRLV